jgi:shikimate dehydrogenase
VSTHAPQFAVIGNPVAHSKSPFIHALFARQTGIAMDYVARLAPLDGFAADLRAFIADGARGANITVPFKLEAYALADTLSTRARAAGAVNTLSFRDGRIEGDNTDGVGLVADIADNAGVPLAGKRVLLLGAGGAARGVLLPLVQCGPAVVTIANRTPAKAAELAQLARSIDAGPTPVEACAFDALRGRYDVVINGTSASLSGALPPVPDEVFGPGTLALDMLYASVPTPFMALAMRHGASARDGCGMLVEQAAAAFQVWHGVRPETAAVLARVRAELGQTT